MADSNLIIDGFHFSTNKDYTLAKSEKETIDYLKGKTDLGDPRTVLKLYSKLIENNTFKTVLGYVFLKELQETIKQTGVVSEEELECIYLSDSTETPNNDGDLPVNQYKTKIDKLNITVRNNRIINLFLAITIVVMMVMGLFMDRSVYTNFEIQTIDKYSTWEENLKTKEEELKIRNEELEMKEEQLKLKE